MQCFFSILVVCLNAGERLKDTLDSIREQTFRDFEVVVKDGMGPWIMRTDWRRRWRKKRVEMKAGARMPADAG